MSEFNIRSESVDVEQIMKQIRARILEKRGADYTEDQIRELASVRLEKFLEPRNLRSDLLEQFRKSRPAVATEPPTIEAPYAFDDQTLFASHRAPLRIMRKLLMPILKLFFNPNVLNQILHTQAQFNVDLLKRESRRKIEFDRSRAEWNALYYEVLHNLVLETTRMGIEAQNLRMRVESLSSRLDFSERRVRALEGVVQYRPEVVHAPIRREREETEPAAAPAPAGSFEGFVPAGQPGPGPQGQGDGSRKRRRRRRGRRGGTGLPGAAGAPGTAGASGAPGASDAGGDYDGPDDADGGEEGDEFDEIQAQATAAVEAPAPAAAFADASASARENAGELRRDLDEAASGREVEPAAPAAPTAPASSPDEQ
jgi:hypothetical protein